MILPSYYDSVAIKSLPNTPKHIHMALPAAFWCRFPSNLSGILYFYAFFCINGHWWEPGWSFPSARAEKYIEECRKRTSSSCLLDYSLSLMGDIALHRLYDVVLNEQRWLLKALCEILGAISWAENLLQFTSLSRVKSQNSNRFIFCVTWHEDDPNWLKFWFIAM